MFFNNKKYGLHIASKILCILAILTLFSPWQVIADATNTPSADYGLKNAAEVAGLKTTPGISARIGTIITTIISFVGVIFLILIVAGGLMWMTAGGSEERITKAKKLIINATVGVIIVFLSYAIVYFVMSKIAG